MFVETTYPFILELYEGVSVMNEQLFLKFAADLDELQKGFNEHEKSFSKFVGASEQRDQRIDEKLDALLNQDKEQDAIVDAFKSNVDDLESRVSAIEIDRKKDKEHRVEKEKEREQAETKRDRKRNLILGIGIVIATVLPLLYQIFVGGV